MLDWANHWAPYDEATYAAVLAAIGPRDVVLDIGAGDLRLTRRLARRARRVYAVERQAAVVQRGLRTGPLPPNVEVAVADARTWPFPAGVTVGVLLMRHCPDVALYMRKLRAVGARWLLTNARWRLDVERVDLHAPRRPFAAVRLGWYACACGAVGFVPGPPTDLTPAVLDQVHEVRDCPTCRPQPQVTIPQPTLVGRTRGQDGKHG